jgi:hypothetical protein
VERVTLLVRAENTAAYTAYISWGFSVIGQIQPFDDSPLYEAMMREMGDATGAPPAGQRVEKAASTRKSTPIST